MLLFIFPFNPFFLNCWSCFVGSSTLGSALKWIVFITQCSSVRTSQHLLFKDWLCFLIRSVWGKIEIWWKGNLFFVCITLILLTKLTNSKNMSVVKLSCVLLCGTGRSKISWITNNSHVTVLVLRWVCMLLLLLAPIFPVI